MATSAPLNLLHPPLLLPGRIHENQGLDGCRGKGANGRQLYCHTCVCCTPFEGDAVRLCHFLFLLFCSVSFGCILQFFFLLGGGGVLLNPFLGANIRFFVLCWLLLFSGVLPIFCFMCWHFAPGHVLENSLGVRFLFLVCFLFFRFCDDAVLYVFVLKRHSSGLTGHTPYCFFLIWFLCFVPPRLCVPFWARALLRFLGFSRNLGGLRSLATSETLGGKGVCGRVTRVFRSFFFLPFCGVCGSYVFLVGRRTSAFFDLSLERVIPRRNAIDRGGYGCQVFAFGSQGP